MPSGKLRNLTTPSKGIDIFRAYRINYRPERASLCRLGFSHTGPYIAQHVDDSPTHPLRIEPHNSNRMEVELRKINALAKVNSEIIIRITGMRVAMWEAYKRRKPSCTVTPSTAQLVHGIKAPAPLCLSVPVNLFNDEIRYECVTFAHLIRLNVEMLSVAKKFAFFGDSSCCRALSELLKFKTNYELLQTALGEIDDRLNSQLASCDVAAK